MSGSSHRTNVGQANTASVNAALEKGKKTSEFLDRIVREVDSSQKKQKKITSASLIGLFVVYVQLLENRIKRFLTLVYSHKAYVIRGNDSLLRKNDFIEFNLGKLVDELKKIKFHNPKTREDYLTRFIKKLSDFNGKRNDYIHRVLNGEIELTKNEFDKAIILAHKDLVELLNSIIIISEKAEKHLAFDGTYEAFADNMLSRLNNSKGQEGNT